MPIPADYAERVYAGVLGKMIGVYLGRPFEGWTYERIMEKLGPIEYYVNDKLNAPLIVTDDDLSGTFTFLRALPDHSNNRDISPAAIGATWLNYIIENRTILWWGGLGNSTEHTAFLRLKDGVAAPRSGAIALNTKQVAEQIGAQIFIDGWAMVAPGDPEFAADLAKRASSVSHDGEAVYGAQVLAAMESLAFVESDLNKLIDAALALIPNNSTIYRLINDLREWHAGEPDWQKTRERIAANYGYDKFGGGCHMVPNHALIIHSLLYGDDDFQKTLMIANTCGWDTDCNSGNAGCLMGIKNGLAAINTGPDWRGPIADRLYLPTADGGRAITDAVAETYHVVNIGLALAGEKPLAPKNGARFHWELPGSVQGWQAERGDGLADLSVSNAEGHSQEGTRSLELRYTNKHRVQIAHAYRATFIPRDAITMPTYDLLASPTLYAGQTVRTAIIASENNAPYHTVTCALFIRVYDGDDNLRQIDGPEAVLGPGKRQELLWTIPDTAGAPIAEIGIEVYALRNGTASVFVDYLTWDGAPNISLSRQPGSGAMWQRAWVNGLDQFHSGWNETYRLIQNRGTGLISQGTSDWTDYTASATLTPHLVKSTGVGVRTQGLRRYYALMLRPEGALQLVKVVDREQILISVPFAWQPTQAYNLRLQASGATLKGWVDDQLMLTINDPDEPLLSGGVALICEEGCVSVAGVRVVSDQ